MGRQATKVPAMGKSTWSNFTMILPTIQNDELIEKPPGSGVFVLTRGYLPRNPWVAQNAPLSVHAVTDLDSDLSEDHYGPAMRLDLRHVSIEVVEPLDQIEIEMERSDENEP